LKQVGWPSALLKRQSSDEGFQRVLGEERGQDVGNGEGEEAEEEELDDSDIDYEEVAVGKQPGRGVR
jgi:hypothetical protein